MPTDEDELVGWWESPPRFVREVFGVTGWSWRPLHLGDLERVAALLKTGLNASQVPRELGLSTSQSYRLRDRAVAMGLVAV